VFNSLVVVVVVVVIMMPCVPLVAATTTREKENILASKSGEKTPKNRGKHQKIGAKNRGKKCQIMGPPRDE